MSAFMNPEGLKPLDMQFFRHVEETSAEERTTHEAACHCGAVQYTVTLKQPFPKYTVNVCNCSICHGNGYLNVYPRRCDVVFTKGRDEMKSYRFKTGKCEHKFCKTCGASLMICFDQREGIAPEDDTHPVNVRWFKDVDLSKLQYTQFNGKHIL